MIGYKKEKSESFGIHTQQKNGLTKLHNIRPHKGHELFQLKNGVVSKVGSESFIENDTVELVKSGGKLKWFSNRKVATEKTIRYVSALNLKNAIKHFLKNGHNVQRGNIDWEATRKGYTKLSNHFSEEEVYFSIDDDLMELFDKYGIKHEFADWGKN